jgi:hypothetical protein
MALDRMIGVLGIVVGVADLACYSTPSAVAPVRTPTVVNASFTRTWSAMIDVFAERTIPLRTLDRASGFAATEEMSVDGSTRWGDCGSDAVHGQVGPRHAIWNVRVKGDSTTATVLVTVRWWLFRGMGGSETRRIDCVTTGAWERAAEADIKARAEVAH